MPIHLYPISTSCPKVPLMPPQVMQPQSIWSNRPGRMLDSSYVQGQSYDPTKSNDTTTFYFKQVLNDVTPNPSVDQRGCTVSSSAAQDNNHLENFSPNLLDMNDYKKQCGSLAKPNGPTGRGGRQGIRVTGLGPTYCAESECIGANDIFRYGTEPRDVAVMPIDCNRPDRTNPVPHDVFTHTKNMYLPYAT